MSVDPLRHSELSAAESAGVAYLESARTFHELPEPPSEEVEDLRTHLATERSAGAAMLSAVLELERRLDTERVAARGLLATVHDLEVTLETDRAELHRQRLENQRQWDDIHSLGCQLRQAERPLWRRLLQR